MFAEFSNYWWLLIFIPFLYFGGKYWVQKKRTQQKTPLFTNNQNFEIHQWFWVVKVVLIGIGI